MWFAFLFAAVVATTPPNLFLTLRLRDTAIEHVATDTTWATATTTTSLRRGGRYALSYGMENNNFTLMDALPYTAEGIWFHIVPSTVTHIWAYIDGTLTNTIHLTRRHFHNAQAIISNATQLVLQRVGPVATQFNIVFLSSGYVASELDVFTRNVTACANLLKNPQEPDFDATVPFHRMFAHMNVFAVFQPSLERGATIPNAGVTVANNLRCTFGATVDTDRYLQCDRTLMKDLAATSPASPILYPLNTVVVVIVNTPRYGGTGIHLPLKFGVFFNGFDLAIADQRVRMASLMYHELGHTIADLMDEYDTGDGTDFTNKQFTNCAMPSPSTPLPWSAWAGVSLAPLPSGSVYKVEAVGTTPCKFSNYVRPTTRCMMGALTVFSMCPVCRERSLVQMYRQGLDTHKLLTSPRCPGLGETVVMAPSESVWVFVGRGLTASRGFTTRWVLGDGRVAGTSVTALLVRASYLTEVAPSPPGGIYNLTFEVTDSSPWVLDVNRVAEMRSQRTFFLFRVDATITSSVAQGRSCQGSMFEITEVTNLNYRSESVETPIPLVSLTSTVSSATLRDNEIADVDFVFVTVTCILGTIGVVMLATVALGGGTVIRVPPYKGTGGGGGISAAPCPPAPRWTVAVMTGVQMMASLVVIVWAFTYYFSTTSPRATALEKVVIMSSVFYIHAVVHFVSFLGFCGALALSKGRVGAYAALSVLFILFPLTAIAFLVGLTKTSFGDDTSAVAKTMKTEWESVVKNDPARACFLEQDWMCSGWAQNCQVVTLSAQCPLHCDAHHATYDVPCRTRVKQFFDKNYNAVFISVVVAGVWVALSIGASGWLAASIGSDGAKRSASPPVIPMSHQPPDFDMRMNPTSPQREPSASRMHDMMSPQLDNRAYVPPTWGAPPPSSMMHVSPQRSMYVPPRSMYVVSSPPMGGDPLQRPSRLPLHQRQYLLRQYRMYDYDQTGYLDCVQFRQYLWDSEKCHRITEMAFQEMFRRADTNGDRRLSFEEFEGWHERDATVLLEAAPREGDPTPMYRVEAPAYFIPPPTTLRPLNFS